MTQTIEKKITLCDRDLNLWLEEAIAFHKIRQCVDIVYTESYNKEVHILGKFLCLP
ncbi:MAG: hypothetical protein ACK5RE_11920 [Pseudanabaena sp.]|jgi:hypothetical protein